FHDTVIDIDVGDLAGHMPQVVIGDAAHRIQAVVWLIGGASAIGASAIIAVDRIAIFLSLERNPSEFSGTSAILRTSSILSTGMIVTRDLNRSSISTSPTFMRGMRTVFIPAFAAASILYVTPPTGRKSPRTESEPVIATSCLTGIPSIALTTAVATLTDAESPSTPIYVPMNWIWISIFLTSLPVNFLRIALTFLIDSWAISLSMPVAITVPLAPCAGVTSAIMGRTDPASLPVTARPLTRPIRVPSTTVISYSLRWRVI